MVMCDVVSDFENLLEVCQCKVDYDGVVIVEVEKKLVNCLVLEWKILFDYWWLKIDNLLINFVGVVWLSVVGGIVWKVV